MSELDIILPDGFEKIVSDAGFQIIKSRWIRVDNTTSLDVSRWLYSKC